MDELVTFRDEMYCLDYPVDFVKGVGWQYGPQGNPYAA